MPEHFINLNCANCGGKLEVYDDMDRFACGYCGTQMLVQRRGGTVAIRAVTEAIERVQVGTDKTAAELVGESNRGGHRSRGGRKFMKAIAVVVVAGIWVAYEYYSARRGPDYQTGVRLGKSAFLIAEDKALKCLLAALDHLAQEQQQLHDLESGRTTSSAADVRPDSAICDPNVNLDSDSAMEETMTKTITWEGADA